MGRACAVSSQVYDPYSQGRNTKGLWVSAGLKPACLNFAFPVLLCEMGEWAKLPVKPKTFLGV